MFNFYCISSIFAAVICVFLGLWAFLSNRKRIPNRAFLACMITFASWITWDALLASQGTGSNLSTTLMLGRILNVGSIGLSVAIIWWVNAVTGKKRDRIFLPIIAAVSGLLVITDLTGPLFIKGLKYTAVDGKTLLVAEYGPFYNIFYAIFAFSMVYAFVEYIRCYRRSGSYKRNQIRYLAVGVVIGIVFPLPVYFLNAVGFSLPRVDNLGCALVALSFAYGMVRYRSMDVRLVIRKGIIYATSLAILVGGYVSLVIMLQALIQKWVGQTKGMPVIVSALAALTIALAFEPLKEKIAFLIDRAFYKDKYDYQQILTGFSKVVATTLSLDTLIRFISGTVNRTLHVDKVLILVLDDLRGEYRVAGAGKAVKTPALSLKTDSGIVECLNSGNTLIIKEELEQLYPYEAARKMRDECTMFGGEVILPMVFQGKLMGIVVLGKKRSSDIYSQEDLRLLTTLFNQTAVAIQNAKLYGEVVAGKDYSESILENMASAVITVDAKGNVTAFNYQAQIITGNRSENMIGKPYDELSNEKNHWISEVLTNTLKNGRVYANYEMPFFLHENSSIPLGISTSPLRDYSDKVIGAIMVLNDLSSVKDLEEKVRRTDRLASLGTMAAGMAHEIRNPLASIKTFIQLLPRKYSDPEFRDSFSQVAAEEVEKINTLINRLLDFARPTPLKLQAVDLGKAMEEILLLLDNDIAERKVTLEKDFEPGKCNVVADKEQIKQVLLNLALNSLQSMEEGGRLRFIIKPGKEKAKVIISDTGCGIKPENLRQLFDPFFSTKSSGSGLGLAIVHRIIDEHGGTINVSSEVGKGTEFTIELLVERSAEEKNNVRDGHGTDFVNQ